MRLNLDTFLDHPGRRFPIDLRLGAEETFSLSEDIYFLEAIEVSGEAFYQLNVLYLSIRIRTVVEQPCSRCLSPVRVKVDREEVFTLPLCEEEEEIDLTSQVLGFITASLDPRPLCRPDCRGLCPHCGINLNEHPEHVCQAEEDDHPKLGDFLR
jgi:uncharacterized protein